MPAAAVVARQRALGDPAWAAGRFSKLAAAVVDSELVLDGDQQQRLLAVFGNEKPLRVHTEYRFDGGGASTLSSPAFSTHWPAAQGAGQNTLAWDGVQIAVDFEKGMKRYTLKADAPRLDLRDRGRRPADDGHASDGRAAARVR